MSEFVPRHPGIAWDPTRKITEHVADHPWAGDEDGHNCADCIAAGDDLRMCWPEVHIAPRWVESPSRQRLGFAGDGCDICGHKDHTGDDHRAGRAPRTTDAFSMDCPNCGTTIHFLDGEMVPHGCDYEPPAIVLDCSEPPDPGRTGGRS